MFNFIKESGLDSRLSQSAKPKTEGREIVVFE